MRRISTLINRLKMDLAKRGLTTHDLLLYLIVAILLIVNIALLIPRTSLSPYLFGYTAPSMPDMKGFKDLEQAKAKDLHILEDYENDAWDSEFANSYDGDEDDFRWNYGIDDEFPNDCFFEEGARRCSSEKAGEKGSFCHWLDGCIDLRGKCNNFWKRCSKNKFSGEKDKTPDPCCACGKDAAVATAGEKTELATTLRLVESLCPYGYPPDEISVLDLVYLLFQTQVYNKLAGCDLNKNKCIDTQQELEAVAKLRHAGPLVLKRKSMENSMLDLILKLFQTRERKAPGTPLSQLDKDSNGCLSEKETLLTRLKMGNCYLMFDGEQSQWTSQSLPDQIGKRYRLGLGIMTSVECKTVLGARWKEVKNSTECLSAGLLPRNIRPQIQRVLTALFEDVRKYGASRSPPRVLEISELKYGGMVAFHESLKEQYEEMQGLKPRYRIPNEYFLPLSECPFRSPPLEAGTPPNDSKNPNSRKLTSISDDVPSELNDFSELNDVSESNDPLWEPKESTSEPKAPSIHKKPSIPTKTLSEPKETLSEPKETLSEPKETLSEPKETPSEPDENASEPKDTSSETISELKKTSLEPRKNISELKKTSPEPRETVSELKKTSSEPKETVSVLKKTSSEPRETVSELKKISSKTNPKDLSEPNETEREEIVAGFKPIAKVKAHLHPNEVDLKPKATSPLEPKKDASLSEPKAPIRNKGSEPKGSEAKGSEAKNSEPKDSKVKIGSEAVEGEEDVNGDEDGDMESVTAIAKPVRKDAEKGKSQESSENSSKISSSHSMKIGEKSSGRSKTAKAIKTAEIPTPPLSSPPKKPTKPTHVSLSKPFPPPAPLSLKAPPPPPKSTETKPRLKPHPPPEKEVSSEISKNTQDSSLGSEIAEKFGKNLRERIFRGLQAEGAVSGKSREKDRGEKDRGEKDRGDKSSRRMKRSEIPDIIHQSWKSRSTIPDFAMGWLSSWPKFNKESTYVFWDDSENEKLIETRFPMFEMAYKSMKPVEKADFARYAYLYEFGGVYADMDSECVRDFTPLRKTLSAFIGEEPYFHAKLLERRDEQFASNALMGSIKHHPFWLFLLTGIVLEDSSGDPVTKTGPRRITNVHKLFFGNGSTGGTAGAKYGYVKVMPEEYFMPEPAWWNYKAMARRCEDAEWENDESTLKACRELKIRYERKAEAKEDSKISPNTYSIHNWKCTWCRGTGTEVFINITDSDVMKKNCNKPIITANHAKFVPCYSN
ncbi:hypothetical protein AAMO2058_001152200 [Amorphochlora amoebiformis]